MLQKEVKVKILKDSINLLVSKTSPSGGGSGQELTSELDGVLANYHKLCDRFKSKCHTLEVTCVVVRSFCVGKFENYFYMRIKTVFIRQKIVLTSVKKKNLFGGVN